VTTTDPAAIRRRNTAVGWTVMTGSFIVGACCGSVTTFASFIAPLLTR
jgi:hypothetical protein